MKTEKIYSWVLRISNSLTGEVEYRTLNYLTATEIEQEAENLLSNNRDLYVLFLNFTKCFEGKAYYRPSYFFTRSTSE